MKKKLLATMAVVPLLGAFGTTGVLAATTKAVVTDSTINGDTATPAIQNEDVKVTVSQDSTFVVVIPKHIELTKGNAAGEYSSTYTVEVTGDIAGNERVEVAPVEKVGTTANTNGKVNVEMVQAGKASLTAEVEQTDKVATSAELFGGKQKDLNGTVNATGVTAGAWEGHFDFNIELK